MIFTEGCMLFFVKIAFIVILVSPVIAADKREVDFYKRLLRQEMTERCAKFASLFSDCESMNPDFSGLVAMAKAAWAKSLPFLFKDCQKQIEAKDLKLNGADACAIYELSASDQKGNIYEVLCKIYRLGKWDTCIEHSLYLEKLNEWLITNDIDEIKYYKSPIIHVFPKIVRMEKSLAKSPGKPLSIIELNLHKKIHPGVIIMEKAPGCTLLSILIDYYRAKPSENDEKIHEELFIIGQQIGNFHHRFGDYCLTEQGKFNGMDTTRHCDPHMSNVMWDKTKNRTYFIDNDRMGKGLGDIRDCRRDIAQLFMWQTNFQRQNIIDEECPGFSHSVAIMKGILPLIFRHYCADYNNHISLHIVIYYEALFFKNSAVNLEKIKIQFNRIVEFLLAIKKGYLSAYPEAEVKEYFSRTIDFYIEDTLINYVR